MKEILDKLIKIKSALGDNCEVSAGTNDFSGITLRVYWKPGHCVERCHSRTEISLSKADLIDCFIDWVKQQKEYSELIKEMSPT